MNNIEASALANEYLSEKTDARRAAEILALLRQAGWKALANGIEPDRLERSTNGS